MLTVRSTINVAGQAVPNIIPAVQGDTGRVIVFTLADFTIPSGSTATYYVQKPSGEAVYNAATINDNKVTVELTAQSLAETGDNYGQVRILNGEDVVTSFDFILLVKPFRGIEAIKSTTEMNIFDKAVQNAMSNIDGMLPNIIAPVFDTSTAYAAGDYVIYSGTLYQFTSNHSGAWTGTDAEECTMTEKLATNTQDITALKEDYDDIDDRVTALEGGGSGSGLTDAMKQALLQIASKVAYIDDQGQTYYDALEEALYPPADLVSISCVYTQSGTVYNSDSLNDLKDDLVVTANYDNGTHQTVTDYNLSGTLTVGTSTISVIWGGMTTTFDVIVSRYDNSVYSWDFTQGITDSKKGVVADIGSGVTQDASGLTFDGSANAYAKLINLSSYSSGYTVEVDVKTITQASGSGPYSIIGIGTSGDGYSPSCGLRINASGNWRFRDTSNNWKDPTPTINGFGYFDNATLKWQVDYSGKKWSLYKDDVLVTENTSTYQKANSRTILGLDTASVDGLGNGSIIKAVRVYAGVV